MTFEEFLNQCRDIIYDNTQSILKKFSSISLWMWIAIFTAKCHYGAGFDELLIVTTLAVLGTRCFTSYYQSKNGSNGYGIDQNGTAPTNPPTNTENNPKTDAQQSD